MTAPEVSSISLAMSHQPSERSETADSACKGRREEKQLCSIHSTTMLGRVTRIALIPTRGCKRSGPNRGNWGRLLGAALGRRDAGKTNHAVIRGAGQFYTDGPENFRIGWRIVTICLVFAISPVLAPGFSLRPNFASTAGR